MGDAKAGLRLVQRGLALEPTGTENLHLLATCYESLGDKEKSIEALSECLRLNKDVNDPNYRGQLYQRGDVYLQMQRYQEAAADFDRCHRCFNICEARRGPLSRAELYLCVGRPQGKPETQPGR